MKTLILISMMFGTMLNSASMMAQQQKQSKVIPSVGIHTVVMTCYGDCNLLIAPSENISIAATMTTEGKMYGIPLGGTSKSFELKVSRQHDTLFIETTSDNYKGGIGINTYHELQVLNVILPPSVTVISADADKQLNAILKKENIGTVACNAERELFVNGKEKNNREYEIAGVGSQTINLRGRKISVETK